MDPRLVVTVQDRFDVLEDRTAVCVRKFIISNPPQGISSLLPPISLDLPSQVSAIEVSQDGKTYTALPYDERPYSKTVQLLPRESTLAGGSREEIYIRFRWKEFVLDQESSTTEIRICQPFPLTYSALIYPAIPGMFPNPRVRFIPPESLNQEEYVVAMGDEHISIVPRLVPSNTNFAASLHLSRRGVPRLPALRALADAAPRRLLFQDVTFIFIQHLLSDFLSLFDAFRQAGLDSRNCFVVGIPYSTKTHVVETLKEWGVPLVETPNTYPFDDVVRVVLSSALAHCKTVAKKLLVVEDGGYISPLFQNDPVISERADDCIGVVEQTRNGIWAFEESLRESNARVAVLSIAESNLKDETESPLIGEAVVRNVENLLSRRETSLRQRNVLLLGCGSIGSKILRQLVDNHLCNVTVSELNAEKRPIRTERVNPISPDDLLKEIPRHSIIIGASGSVPFNTVAHFKALQNNAILVNATSKLREFCQRTVRQLTERRVAIPGFGHELKLVTGNSILFVANGFPVNFFNSESVAGELMQPILGLLLTGAQFLVETSPAIKGKLAVPPELQERVKRTCEELRPI